MLRKTSIFYDAVEQVTIPHELGYQVDVWLALVYIVLGELSVKDMNSIEYVRLDFLFTVNV